MMTLYLPFGIEFFDTIKKINIQIIATDPLVRNSQISINELKMLVNVMLVKQVTAFQFKMKRKSGVELVAEFL